MDTGNMFIDQIYSIKRSKYPFIQKIKLWVFLYKLKKVAPDFNMLWAISGMLKLLQIVYLYPNTSENTLHTVPPSKKYKETETSFGLYVNNCKIVFTLVSTDRSINIEIFTINKNSVESRSNVKFVEGNAVVDTVHDEQLFININDWLMEAVIDLIKQCTK